MEDFSKVEALADRLTTDPERALDVKEIGAKWRMERSAPNAIRLLCFILDCIERGEDFSNPRFYGTEHQQIRGLLASIKDGI